MRILPVGAAVRHMLSSTLNNLGFAWRAQWPWMVIAAAVLIGLGALFPDAFGGDPKGLEKSLQGNPGQAGIFLLLFLATLLVVALAFSSCAVAWHRYVLLDEVPKGLARLRVDGTVWRYLGNLLLIALIVVVPTIPLALFVVPLMAANTSLGIFAALAYSSLVLVPIIYRLSIKLPAVALGRSDFKLRDAWASAAGNWWQLAAVGFLVSAISWATGLALKAVSLVLAAVASGTAGFLLDVLLQVGVNWVVTILGITLLTSLYGFFVEKREF